MHSLCCLCTSMGGCPSLWNSFCSRVAVNSGWIKMSRQIVYFCDVVLCITLKNVPVFCGKSNVSNSVFLFWYILLELPEHHGCLDHQTFVPSFYFLLSLTEKKSQTLTHTDHTHTHTHHCHTGTTVFESNGFVKEHLDVVSCCVFCSLHSKSRPTMTGASPRDKDLDLVGECTDTHAHTPQ